MKNKTAFSLLELAVVTVIIGLISAALVKGVSIVRSSRITMARSLTVEAKISDISGLIAWYETSMVESFKKNEVTDEAQITAWYSIAPDSIADKKNALTKSAASNFVLEADGINSLPAIKTSTNGKITLANFFQGSSNLSTVFLVFQPTASPSSSAMILLDSSTAASDNTAIGIKNNTIYVDCGSAVNTSTSSNPAVFSAYNDYVIAVNLANSESKAFANNAQTMAGAATISTGSNSLTGLNIGTNRLGSSGFSGLISEVIIFNRILSAQERKSVMAYLSKKYKIRVLGL